MSIRLICTLLLIACNASAIELTSEKRISLDEFWIYEDNTHHYKANTILTASNKQWQKITKGSINLGYTQSTVWIKFNLNNPDDIDRYKLLDINYPLLDYITLYETTNNQITTLIQSGDSRPFNSRHYKHPNYVSSINFSGNSQHQYLLKIRSNAPIQTEIIIWEPDEFQYFYRTKASFTFLYLGILISTALFNLVVFIFMREKTFLMYGLYASSITLLMASQDAILFEYIFPNSPVYHNWSQLILGGSTLSLTCAFNLIFLKLNKNSNGRLLYIFTFVPIFIIFSSLIIGYPNAIQLMVLSILIIMPTCFVIGVVHSKNNENRIYYLLAWGWLISGVIIFAFSKLGALPFNIFTNNSIQIGSALELLTFAIALAKRLHTEKEKRIQAQDLIIESTRQSANLQKELLYNATHNDITGLPNRNLISSEINYLCNNKIPFSLILIRLSRIVELDKTLGREISNYILEKISISINSKIQNIENIHCMDEKESFYAASLSNSTFGFIILNPHKSDLTPTLTAFISEINNPILVNELLIDPWLMLGYSNYANHGNDADSLLRNAGIALDCAIETDNSICCYHESQDTYNHRKLILINELKDAIANNKLALLYQPLINTQSEEIIGAEALIRWPHQDYGMIFPDEFIEIAEQTGIIQALSLWVFKNALHQLKQWLKVNPNFLMSINISAQNLKDKNFINAISVLISDNEELASNMILEITETQMMGDTHHTLENLWRLHEQGFNIAIDDFGTGYSNLSYLKKLPANELKIDKIFILDLEGDKQNQVLVQTAIQMAHNLGLKVVAEGVESEHTRVILEKMNCDMCQGFHFSRPVSADQFHKLIN